MKSVIKFFVYMGLISIILYLSGCFYNPQTGFAGHDAKINEISEDKAAVVLTQNDTEHNNIMGPDLNGTTTVVLYFDNGKGSLVAERREVPKVAGIARQTMLELILGPNNKALLASLPHRTQLLDINIRDGLCTVNFSHHLKTNHSGGSSAENLTVYAVVNTLTQFSSIDLVQIMVEGEIIESLAGHIDVGVPLARNDDLISSI